MDFVALFTSASFWFDIICVIALILLCRRYVRLGFLAAVVQILGTVISLFCANMFATLCDTWVYNTIFSKPLQHKIEAMVEQSGTTGIEELSNAMLSMLPDSLLTQWQGEWMDLAGIEVSNDIDVIVETIMQSTVAPVITQIVFMVLFFVGFLVCRILLYFLVQLLRSANYLPVIGSVNRVFGWVFGALGGCIDLFLGLCVVWLFILLTDGIVPIINMNDLANSWFFEIFKELNPFL